MQKFSIALDVSFQYSAGGFGSYTRELLKQFIKQHSNSTVLLVENELPVSVPQYAHSEEYKKIEIPEKWETVTTSCSSRLWWMKFYLPKILKEYQPRIFHSVDNVSVPRRKRDTKTVLTLHDIIPLSHPQYARRRDALAASLLIPRALKHSEKVITDSYFSAKQICDRYPRYAEKVNVVYLGVDHELYFPVAEKLSLSESMQKKYKLFSSQFFFNVSTLSPRKNLNRLLRAFHRFVNESKHSDCCLVVAGCDGWNYQPVYELINELEISDQVHFLGFVTDEDLVQLYQSAFAFVFPSLLEGFGLPVLEAMACGTPAICSNTTSLYEMFDGSAMTIDPNNVSEIQAAMNDLVVNPAMWKELSEKGLELAGSYDWSKTAKEVVSVYKTVLES